MGEKEDRVVNVHSLIEVLERFVKHAKPGNPNSQEDALQALKVMNAMFSEHPPPQWQCRPPDTYPEIPEG